MTNRPALTLTTADGAPAPDGLRRFLTRDPGLQRVARAAWQPAAPPDPGHLGTGLDILTLVITGALALPSAIDTVRRWCAATGGDGNAISVSGGGVSVTVSGATTPEQAAALAATLTAALQPVPDAAEVAAPEPGGSSGA
ncbi:effector-associated constant component EACC1 [Streptomyces sp. NBC_00483]|uniref:effector-associated constant component EACC1 n=1 Tax=Streptomyces sp. NBC_00483 TaxID=2975756 RepID=UPI002E16C87A